MEPENLSPEVWKPAPGTDSDYQVSSHGRVSGPLGTILKRRVTIWGYDRFAAKVDGKVRDCSVHQAVCEAFHGPRPTPAHEVNHINGERLDNRPENLEWVTRKENSQHKKLLGTDPSRERNPRAKLTEGTVAIIRRLRAEGRTYKALGEQFGVHKNTIWWIAAGKTWPEGAVR